MGRVTRGCNRGTGWLTDHLNPEHNGQALVGLEAEVWCEEG